MRFDDVKSIAWVIMQTETEVWILNEGDKVIQSFFYLQPLKVNWWDIALTNATNEI